MSEQGAISLCVNGCIPPFLLFALSVLALFCHPSQLFTPKQASKLRMNCAFHFQESNCFMNGDDVQLRDRQWYTDCKRETHTERVTAAEKTTTTKTNHVSV